MRKVMGLCLVFCVAFGPTYVPSALAKDNDLAKKEVDQLQGNWRVVASQVGGEKALPEEFEKRRLTFNGDKLIYEYGNEQKEKREGTIKLEPKSKAFDWTITSGETMLAIYDLNGDDLKIGFGNDGLLRPRRWEIGKEDVAWLLVLKRERPDAKPPTLLDDAKKFDLPK